MLLEEYLDWQNFLKQKPNFDSDYIVAIKIDDDRYLYRLAQWDAENEYFFQTIPPYTKIPLQNVTHWYLIENLPNPTNFC